MALLKGHGTTNEVYYYQLDHLGTPQELTDASGKIVWSAHYRAYGNVIKFDINEISNPLRFQGQYYDEESGLHYNRDRYYNPNTGRYLTPDPIKLAGGLNSYQYVPNPTGWVDPLGLMSVEGDCPKGQSSSNPEIINDARKNDPSIPGARITKARLRQEEMLVSDIGFNITPIGWDKYPSIGREGTFISDEKSIRDLIGDFHGQKQIITSKDSFLKLETAFGLDRGSLGDSFKIRKIDSISERSPRSPLFGNDQFQGPGNHLPGGAPEIVIDPISTTDGNGATTISTVTSK